MLIFVEISSSALFRPEKESVIVLCPKHIMKCREGYVMVVTILYFWKWEALECI